MDYFESSKHIRSYKSKESQRLIKDHGVEGYGIYCYICFKVAGTRDGMLLTSFEELGKELEVDTDKIRQVVEGYELFIVDKGFPYIAEGSVIISNPWRAS